MNEEELEWIANRHEGEMMYFQSNNGIKDTAIVYNIEIYNSLNPFNMAYFNTSNTEYIAGGCIDYSFNRSTGCVGTLYVQKLYNNKPLFFSGGLLGRWSKEIPLKLTTLEVNNVTFNDILFFNEMNTEQITNYNQANPIKSYAWSKKYGLVQYTFQDGTVFSRVGNIAAGYVAGVNGMSWEASRIAFDSYQGGMEGKSTRNAERYGWTMGYNNASYNKKMDNLLRSSIKSLWDYFAK